jgi:hypothetical protein
MMPKVRITTLIASIVTIGTSRARRIGIVESSECRRAVLAAPVSLLPTAA